MVLFNYSTRELTAKIVYYGPGICGKTTNLQFIHENLPGAVRGKMLSLATKTDRTLFFDFLPIDLGEIRGMKTRVQLYTVPGQVFYNETRKLVLKGVDGIVFVADSQETMLGANVESFKNLEENLKAHGIKLQEIPHVIQFNKRDLPKLSGIEDLNAALNKYNAPFYESVATTGIGVQDTLKAIVKLVLLNLTRKYESKTAVEAEASLAVAPAAMAAGSAAAAAASEPRRAHIPLAPVEPPAPKRRVSAPAPPPVPAAPAKVRKAAFAPPPPPAPTPAPAEAMSPFAESEIDSLVGEVGDVPEIPVPETAIPVAAAAPADEGSWMGLREDETAGGFADESSAYGSSVPLEDLLAASDESAATASVPLSVPEPAVEDEWRPIPSSASEFEVDRGFDPEWPAEPPVAARAPEPPAAVVDDDAPIAPFPIPLSAPAADEMDEPDVRLTEIASDEDLFSDPSLEIAHLVVGQTREIMVPVMLGEGATAGRFKLAIRLRLEPVD